MATEIFISYASADRSKADKLSAFLESKGYAVWYDRAIEAAEHYRDSIGEQIDEARVVICIWTPVSIRSDRCRAEANRARILEKLIPVRSTDLDHGQIPLPFGELHTISLSDEEQIERAVAKRLLGPRIMVPWYRRIWGGTKHELLSWLSIIGAVLTLTTGLKELFSFAPLIRFLTDNFLTLTNQLWSTLLFFLPKVTLYDCVLLNLWLFFFVLFITSCSRSYVNPPLLSEKYLRDNLFGAIAAFIIVYIFAMTAKNLQSLNRADSYVFGNLVSFVADLLFRGQSPDALIAARLLVMLGLIVAPVAIVLGLGYRFDPAKYASRMWRVVAGLTAVGVLNFAYEQLAKAGLPPN